jgi:hypothetical protein
MQNVSRQRIGKHVPAAMCMHTIELLLETVFPMWSVPRSYLEENWGHPAWEFSLVR